MSTQMTIRLSDRSAAFIDGLVADGAAISRASAIDQIVLDQARDARAKRDAEIYAALPDPDPDEERSGGEWAIRNAADAWADLD